MAKILDYFKSLQAHKLYLFAFYSWAFFSFVSNSLLSLNHVFVVAAFSVLVSSKKGTFKMTRGQLSLVLFILVAIISIFLNWSDLARPTSKIFKLKYFLVAFLAYTIAKNYVGALKKYRYKILLFFISSFSLTVIYGLGRFAFEYFAQHSIYRLTGFFGMIMSYAYTAVWPLLLMLFLALQKDLKVGVTFLDKQTWRWFLFWVFFIVLCLTQARGALLGFVVAIPFLFLKNQKSFFLSLFFVALLLFSAFLKVKSSDNRVDENNRVFQGTNSQSNLERISQFDMAYHAFLEKPILGQGWRSLEERSPHIKNKYDLGQKSFSGHAHNNFLEVLATTGLLGFVLFLSWLIFWFRESFVLNHSEWRYFYLSGLVAFVVSGLFQSTIIDSEYAFTLFAFYGLTPLFTDNSPS